MKEKGDFVEEPKDVAQLLNKYFVEIGKNVACFSGRRTRQIVQTRSPYQSAASLPQLISNNSLLNPVLTPCSNFFFSALSFSFL